MILTRRVPFDPVAAKCSEIFDNLGRGVDGGVQTYVC